MVNSLSGEHIEDMLKRIRCLQGLIINDFETLIRDLALTRNVQVPDEFKISSESSGKEIPSLELPEVLNVKGIQKYLGIGRVQAYNLVNSGKFRVVNVGRRKLIERKAFVQWLSENP